MSEVVSIINLKKIFQNGVLALNDISLGINRGEILALLGPNGAGKTTMISIICGIVNPSEGKVLVEGHDVKIDYRRTRSLIGLVPQELVLEAFETVLNTVRFSRGLFGKAKDDQLIEKILKQLSLWDKRNTRIIELSGGMKRRLLIAKALSHEPKILFLDEPTAGVDVELRKDMWNIIRELKSKGVTIILTTHYIEEAEAIADRVGILSNGRLLIVEEKEKLIKKMGSKLMIIELEKALKEMPESLKKYKLSLSQDRKKLEYKYNKSKEKNKITKLLLDINNSGISFTDIKTNQSSLEDIFVDLTRT
tara:strand:+ start:1619 stop:2539 length:921 start_codon:yes stop_codon:yes gene_type:complete